MFGCCSWLAGWQEHTLEHDGLVVVQQLATHDGRLAEADLRGWARIGGAALDQPSSKPGIGSLPARGTRTALGRELRQSRVV